MQSDRSMTSSLPPWSELPPELLGLVVSFLADPADRAQFRAVCHSWRSAMRHYCPPTQLPWAVLPEGYFFTHSDGRDYPLPSFAEGKICVGSTDTWLALDHDPDCDNGHVNTCRYLLHDPFLNKSVPLTELDAIIADETSVIRKVLMRSGTDDLVAVLTHSYKYPLILTRPGEGAWPIRPRRALAPVIFVIDVAFLGDKLYGITKAEDLLPINLVSDGNGMPVVMYGERLIKQPSDYNDYDMWVSSDYEDAYEEEGDAVDEEDDGPLPDGAYDYEDEDDSPLPDGFDCAKNGDDPMSLILTIRYLVESCGKLLMVRRQLQMQCSTAMAVGSQWTNRVEVFEADTEVGAWVPTNGLGRGGQSLFVSTRFSKSVSAPFGEVEEDAIYFIDTGEVFNIKSGTISLPRWAIPLPTATWVLPPDFVL